jgi:hypothetical protein
MTRLLVEHQSESLVWGVLSNRVDVDRDRNRSEAIFLERVLTEVDRGVKKVGNKLRVGGSEVEVDDRFRRISWLCSWE